MPRLVFSEGTSNKFWEAHADGKKLVIRFGRIGTDGQEQVKSFATPAAARAELDKREKAKRAEGYVDEGGKAKKPKAAAKPAPKAAAKAAKAEKAAFPFLYYGRAPADWREGSNLGYRFDVRFEPALAKASQKKAEETFRKALKKSAAVDLARDPWAFAGEWATLFVGDRYLDWTARNGDSVGLYDALWNDLAAAFEAVHRVAPIAEVVNRNQRAPSKKDAWTQWSVGQKQEHGRPTSGPFSKW